MLETEYGTKQPEKTKLIQRLGFAGMGVKMLKKDVLPVGKVVDVHCQLVGGVVKVNAVSKSQVDTEKVFLVNQFAAQKNTGTGCIRYQVVGVI